MIRDPLTGRWTFLPIEIWQEKDHQAHVRVYWEDKIEKLAITRKAPEEREWSFAGRAGDRMRKEFTQAHLDLPLCDL